MREENAGDFLFINGINPASGGFIHHVSMGSKMTENKDNNEIKSGGLWGAIVVLVGGIGVATYQTYIKLRLQNDPTYKSSCNQGDAFNCDAVMTSSWSEIGGIPISLFAIPAYAIMIYLAWRGLSGVLALLRLRGIELPAVAVVSRGLLACLLGLAELLESLRRAEATIGLSALEQRSRSSEMPLDALALVVGAPVSADLRSLVPVDPEPAKALEDARLGLLGGALAVGILDAEHEGSTSPAGVGPVEEGGPRPADVEMAGGTRRETGPHGLHAAALMSALNI